MRRVLPLLIFLTVFSMTAAQDAIFPVSITTDLVNPDVPPNEIQHYSISLTPTSGSGRVENIRLSVYGEIAGFVILEATSVNLDYGETQEIGIQLDTEGESVGTYSGSIIVGVGDNTREIPITVRIIEKEAKIDLTMEIKTKKVKPPGPIKFLVTIYNVGQKDKSNLHMSHKLNSLDGEVLAEQDEFVTLVTSLSLERSFFSEDLSLEAGTYYIETTARYDSKDLTFSDTFVFVEPFWNTTRIAIALFVIVVVAFVASFWYTGLQRE